VGIDHFPQITNNMGGMSRKKCDKIGKLAKKHRFFWDVGSKTGDSIGESYGSQQVTALAVGSY